MLSISSPNTFKKVSKVAACYTSADPDKKKRAGAFLETLTAESLMSFEQSFSYYALGLEERPEGFTEEEWDVAAFVKVRRVSLLGKIRFRLRLGALVPRMFTLLLSSMHFPYVGGMWRGLNEN
jgi:hypothetical protein